MASASANPTKESNDQVNQPNQTLESSNETKNVILTPSPNVGETVSMQTTTLERHRKTGQQNDLPSHLYDELCYDTFSASPLRSKIAYAEPEMCHSDAPHARPFDEFSIDKPLVDTPISKPGNNSSSSSNRLA